MDNDVHVQSKNNKFKLQFMKHFLDLTLQQLNGNACSWSRVRPKRNKRDFNTIILSTDNNR